MVSKTKLYNYILMYIYYLQGNESTHDRGTSEENVRTRDKDGTRIRRIFHRLVAVSMSNL